MAAPPSLTAPLLADDLEIAHRLLAHIDAGTTDEGEPWREPVANYVDPARLEEELALLRSLPSAFVPSAAIPGAGDHIDRTAAGVPLFAVRDRTGRARVFRNACRHRGVALVDGAGCAQSLVCPYHGWTYRLDGSLSNVPHADGFPGLDAGERGLVEVPSDEIDGLIVIDPTATGAVRQHDAPWTGRAWRGALPPSLHLAGVSTTVQPMSWKVLVEQFLEGYHIRTTHRTTFYPLQYDNLNVVETFGANSRVTYPYRNIERLRDRPESTWDLGHRVTYVYHLFPNVIIATFPDMAIVATIDPIDLDHSTFTVFTLTAAEQSSPADEGGASDRLTGRALVDAGGVEDNAMSLAVQRGMHAGANEFVEFGRYESAIGHFHRNLTERLALHRG